MICCGDILVDIKKLIPSSGVTTISTCELVDKDTVDGRDNLKEKTREVTDIRIHRFAWNFLQQGCDMPR